jgi:hypothetical protein
MALANACCSTRARPAKDPESVLVVSARASARLAEAYAQSPTRTGTRNAVHATALVQWIQIQRSALEGCPLVRSQDRPVDSS